MSSEIGAELARITGKIQVVPSVPNRCGEPHWLHGEQAGCNGMDHFTAAGTYAGHCPAAVADKIRERVQGERQRLCGALGRAFGNSSPDWAGYDPKRARGAPKALGAMRRYAGERTPTKGVLLSGETGLGKSRLLLTSHFSRLEAGYPSEYVTAAELRKTFQGAASFDEGRRRESEGVIDHMRRAPALHIDDLGDVRGSEAFHANFAAGFKGLLDDMWGKFAVALNLNSEQARQHPDVGERVLSRLADFQLVEVVRMEGEDQRLAVVR